MENSMMMSQKIKHNPLPAICDPGREPHLSEPSPRLQRRVIPSSRDQQEEQKGDLVSHLTLAQGKCPWGSNTITTPSSRLSISALISHGPTTPPHPHPQGHWLLLSITKTSSPPTQSPTVCLPPSPSPRKLVCQALQ